MNSHLLLFYVLVFLFCLIFFIRRAEVCECVCRRSFMKPDRDFSEVKHVIMDEVQNFRAEDGDWLQKARGLVAAPPDDPDRDPGYLWLFIDNDQINHRYATGIPSEEKQIQDFRLKRVIRNSERIFDHSKTFLPPRARNKIVLGHDFRGDKVKHVLYSGGKPFQLRCLKGVLKNLLAEGYSKGEIAVLFGKEVCIPMDLSNKLNIPVIVDSEKNNSNHLVVSTIRMYSGLERPAVVLVDLDESLPYGSLPSRSKYCAVTRAMVKLVIVERK